MDHGANRAYDVAVGGQGIQWGYGYGLREYLVGYPSHPPYDGSLLYHCAGTTRDEGGFPALDCGMTAGERRPVAGERRGDVLGVRERGEQLAVPAR